MSLLAHNTASAGKTFFHCPHEEEGKFSIILGERYFLLVKDV